MSVFGTRTRRGLALALCLLLHPGPAAVAASVEEARTLAQTGQLDEALSMLEDILAGRPDDVSAQLLRGVVLSRAGRSDEAIDVFNAIARARPELPEPHNNLAVLYAARGSYEEARGALVEAIRLQPEYALAHENLGDVYAKLAALSYARANQLDPGNEDAARKFVEANGLIGEGDAPAVNAEAAARPATAAPPAAQQGACVRVARVAPRSRADEVARWLRERGLNVDVTAGGAARTSTIYRVYVPPLGSASAARARIAELKKAGITDLIMIASGENRHGISLGAFKSRDSAQRHAQDLASRGIQTRVERRGPRGADAADVRARGELDNAAFTAAFPDLRAEPIDCP